MTDDIRALPLELFEKDEQAHEDADKISRPSVTYWSDAWRRFRRNKVAMVSAIVLILIAVLAIVVPMVSSYTYDKTDLMAVNQGPSGEHLFGTDDLGRDIFVRCWEGARVSLFIALVVSILNGTIGIYMVALPGILEVWQITL